jgi:hypothetical protein
MRLPRVRKVALYKIGKICVSYDTGNISSEKAMLKIFVIITKVKNAELEVDLKEEGK